MRLKYICRQLLVTVGCAPLLAFAATPTVNSISGTVQSGQTLTINGTNMVNENRTNWDAFFSTNTNATSFEGANPVADGYSSPGNPDGGTYDTDVSLLGGQSMKFNVSGQSVCPPGNLKDDYNGMDPEGGDEQNEYWIRFYARWRLNGGGWPDVALKMLKTQGNIPGPAWYFQPTANSVGSLPTQFDAIYDGGGEYASIPSGQLQNDRWYGIELHWKTSGGNLYEAWIDGTQVVNAVPSNYVSLEFLMIGIINTCNTNSSFSLDHWWDGFAVSKSRVNLASIVEIGNSSDYATATKVYQAPEFLSDTSSQIKVNLAGLGAGPYYLWVTNNRGERSQPYNLDGSTVTIAAPSNLQVQ